MAVTRPNVGGRAWRIALAQRLRGCGCRQDGPSQRAARVPDPDMTSPPPLSRIDRPRLKGVPCVTGGSRRRQYRDHERPALVGTQTEWPPDPLLARHAALRQFTPADIQRSPRNERAPPYRTYSLHKPGCQPCTAGQYTRGPEEKDGHAVTVRPGPARTALKRSEFWVSIHRFP